MEKKNWKKIEETRKEYKIENNKKELEKQIILEAKRIKEEISTDLTNFIIDMNKVAVTIADLERTGKLKAMPNIPQDTLTNFLLWKLLKGRL